MWSYVFFYRRSSARGAKTFWSPTLFLRLLFCTPASKRTQLCRSQITQSSKHDLRKRLGQKRNRGMYEQKNYSCKGVSAIPKIVLYSFRKVKRYERDSSSVANLPWWRGRTVPRRRVACRRLRPRDSGAFAASRPPRQDYVFSLPSEYVSRWHTLKNCLLSSRFKQIRPEIRNS